MYAARLKRKRERERGGRKREITDQSWSSWSFEIRLHFTGETRNKGLLLKGPMSECFCNVPDGRFQRKDAHISEMQISLPEGEGLVIGRWTRYPCLAKIDDRIWRRVGRPWFVLKWWRLSLHGGPPSRIHREEKKLSGRSNGNFATMVERPRDCLGRASDIERVSVHFYDIRVKLW